MPCFGVYRSLILVGACALALCVSTPSYAASEEIQVYMDDMKSPGRLGVDIHNNYVFSGRRTPDYDGEQPPLHVYRFTPEFTLGLTKSLELGVYVLTTRAPQGDTHLDGGKVRIKYIAPHDENAGVFWGVNLEVGRTSRRVSDTSWNTQLKGILGYRTGRWTLAVNPNIDGSLSKGGGPATGELDLKINYGLSPKTEIGLESYNEVGPLRRVSGLNQNSKTVFAVIDTQFAGIDLNAGVGRGLTADSDHWLIKFIVGLQF